MPASGDSPQAIAWHFVDRFGLLRPSDPTEGKRRRKVLNRLCQSVLLPPLVDDYQAFLSASVGGKLRKRARTSGTPGQLPQSPSPQRETAKGRRGQPPTCPAAALSERRERRQTTAKTTACLAVPGRPAARADKQPTSNLFRWCCASQKRHTKPSNAKTPEHLVKGVVPASLAFKQKAERGRFELPVGLTLRRFSRPVHSATLPPLRERLQ